MHNRLLIPLSFLLAWTADPTARAAPGQTGQTQSSDIVWRDDPNEAFDNLDINDDGRLDVGEWPWWRASFEDRDLNHNGVLSRREFDEGGGALTSGFGPPMIATITVRADERWTDTGVEARVGDRMMFDAVGTIQLSGLPEDVVTLTGSRSLLPGPRAAFPAQPAGGLILRIGNDDVVFVGDRRRLRMPASGRLYLGLNDADLADNSGAFRVTMTRLTGVGPETGPCQQARYGSGYPLPLSVPVAGCP